MPLSEKTLEILITHEILSLADRFSEYHYNYPLHRRFRKKLPYVMGLSLSDEIKKGYDVRIELPDNWGDNGTPYIYFLQFKRGYHKDYSNNKYSIFNKSKGNKTEHVLFGINNNSTRDQHIKLRNLLKSIQFKNRVLVGYALPLISSISMLKNCAGDLLVRTLIFAVNDIDTLASKGIIGSILINEDHHIAISYNTLLKEIRSTPAEVQLEDISIKFFNEIFAVRIFKQLKLNITLDLKTDLSVDSYLIDLGFELGLEEIDIIQILDGKFNRNKSDGYKFNKLFTSDIVNYDIQERRETLFKAFVKTTRLLVSSYYEATNKNDLMLVDVMELRFLKSFEIIDNNHISFSLSEDELNPFNLEEISYTII